MHNKRIGEYGENLACQYLKKKGYKIIVRNIKMSYQELDIVALFNNTIIFLEVKTRIESKLLNAEEAMTDLKYQNLKKAISHFLSDNQWWGREFRLDLIAIYLNREKNTANIKHYIDIL